VGVFHADLAARARRIHGFHRGVDHDVDAGLPVFFIELLAHLFVLVGHDARQELHDGHLGADGVVEVAELHADGPRTHDHHRGGLLFEHHGLAVADDLLVVDLQVGQFAGPAAGSQDDVLGFVDGLFAVRAGHFHLFALLQLARAGNVVDLVFAEEELHALGHAGGHVAAALDHAAEVGLGVAHLDAVVLRVVDVFEHLGAFEQGLGGNAAPVEAHAAQFGHLHYAHFHLQLRSANSGYVPPRTAADHE
jgi:hypothetical protein